MLNILKHYIKSIYKKFIILIFLFLYKKPLFKKKFTNQNFEVKKVKIKKTIYKVFFLKKGRVYTNKNDVTAYISHNNYITEGSMQFKKFDNINSSNQTLDKNETIKIGTPNLKKKVNGNILSLLSGGASRDNFTHWFTDVVPRIFLYKKKYKLKDIKKFYVPSFKYRFQIESLNLLDIKTSQLISSEHVKHLEAKKIYYTSHPCHFYPNKSEKWALDELRKSYIPKKLKKNNDFKKIFIDRDQLKLIDKNNLKKYSSWRVLLNENEIKKFLKSKGFSIIKPENFSFKKQIEIFNNANYVISLYGAAMMMLTFCNKKVKIIEIKPKKSGDEFKKISDNLNFKHEQIKIKPKFESSTPQNGLLFCNINLVKEKLKKLKF